MGTLPEFKKNNFFTMGVEIELQLIDLQDFNLAMEARDFLRRLSATPHPGELKPEITLSMIEFNSSIHTLYNTLLAELHSIKDIIASQAAKTHIGVCGGGTHPFQKWQDQRIFPKKRFATVSEHYGYLAKQFTVFGQHIHIGCRNADESIYLCHAMARYLPQFIALSAASPFYQSIDTNFDCSRLTVISSFPLSGTPPWMLTWEEFEAFFENMFNLGIINSMKDFYWDIRPKPEFGTIELRICDTPLTLDKAADLAAYAQMLVYWLMDTKPELSQSIYLTYIINRFNATRYGLDAIFIDPLARVHIPIVEDILYTCRQLEPYAKELDSQLALDRIRESARRRINDAGWIRKEYAKHQSLNDLVKAQTELWSS